MPAAAGRVNGRLTAGILNGLAKGTRFGVTYSSPVKLNFPDAPAFSNLGLPPGDLRGRGLQNRSPDLGVTVSRSVMASFYHEFNDRWALLGNDDPVLQRQRDPEVLSRGAYAGRAVTGVFS